MFTNKITIGAGALFVGIAGMPMQLGAAREAAFAMLPLFAIISGLSIILIMGWDNAAASQTEAPL